MGRSQRAKGAAWERELVRRFREAMPGVDVKRGLQPRGGDEVPDVDAGPLWIEAKVGAKPPIRKALEDATASAPEGRVPVAVIKEDRRKPFAVIGLGDFLRMVAGVPSRFAIARQVADECEGGCGDCSCSVSIAQLKRR